ADGLREHLDRWRVAGVVATPLLQELRPVVELVEEVSELVRDLGEHAIVSGRVTILEPRTVCWRVGGGDARFGFRRLVGRHRRSDWAANAQEPAGYGLVRTPAPETRKARATRIQLTRDADHYREQPGARPRIIRGDLSTLQASAPHARAIDLAHLRLGWLSPLTLGSPWAA